MDTSLQGLCHVSVHIFALLPIKTPDVGFGPILGPHLFCIPPAKSLFPNEVTCTEGWDVSTPSEDALQLRTVPDALDYEMQALGGQVISEFHSKLCRCTI